MSIKELESKKGQASLEETPGEKIVDIILILLFIFLIAFFLYLAYRVLVYGDIPIVGRGFLPG